MKISEPIILVLVHEVINLCESMLMPYEFYRLSLTMFSVHLR